jgi:hypothetical protein
MKGNIGLLAALVWLAASGIAVAQEEKPAATSSTDNTKVVQSKAEYDRAKRSYESFSTKLAQANAESDRVKRSYEIYESVEIMRRILNRTLTNLSGPSLGGTVHGVTDVAFSPDGKLVATTMGPGEVRLWRTDGTFTQNCRACHDLKVGARTDCTRRDPNLAPDHEVEGIYLKDYGVVFSVMIPVGRVMTAAGAIKAPNPAPSEWERAKSELRGEKVDAEEKKTAPEPVSLTDAILKVLAENGRHFSRLAGDERLTVVVTLRTAERPAKTFDFQVDMQGTTPYRITNPTPADFFANPVIPGYGRTYNYTGPGNQQPGPGNDPSAGARQSAANYAHLGDMRLKQGRIKESVEAYEKAAADYQKVVESIKADMGGERWKQKMAAAGEAADALMKLSQSYLLQGEKDRAYQVFNRAAELSSWAVSGKSGEAKAKTGVESSKLTLPGRLILSTPRVLLEHLATGKITFEEFKKAAEIQYLDF